MGREERIWEHLQGTAVSEEDWQASLTEGRLAVPYSGYDFLSVLFFYAGLSQSSVSSLTLLLGPTSALG